MRTSPGRSRWARRCGRGSMPAESVASWGARVTTMSDDNSLLRVLVIDDQSQVRTFARKVLLTMGITNVTEAEDGRDALAAVTQPGAWFDLILCDLQMPERDGIETIRSFGALGLESAIAIMSVEEARVIETAGMLAEVQGLRMLGTIAKPVTAEKLEPILKRLRQVPNKNVDDTFMAPDQDRSEEHTSELQS